MEFIYTLAGWEGSAHDGRVLRDALIRPNGLKVSKGRSRPRTTEELFNMRHSSARNTIERAFGILKMRWAILRDTTWFSPKGGWKDSEHLLLVT
ncbi:hypothetical protein LINPERPRIM_LOCUS24812 [Linum perenne]